MKISFCAFFAEPSNFVLHGLCIKKKCIQKKKKKSIMTNLWALLLDYLSSAITN